MTGAIESRTPNYSLRRINFDWTTWHDEMNDNMSDLDAVIAALTGITDVAPWANSTAYVVGDKAIDSTLNRVYICAVNHTSAASPTTFATDRTNHSTYWTLFGSPPTAATWTTATAFRQGTWITDDDNRTAVALVDFTSGATMDDDIADDYLLVVADFTGLADAAADAIAAAVSTAADAASTAADRVAVAADAATVASNTATVANNTSISTANAASAMSDAAAAAVSAAAAATSYDNFDDRYLGSKAADPTLDNDGNALLTGALYFNTVSNVMRVYNGSSWQTVAAAGTLTTGDIGVTVMAQVAPSTSGNVLTSNGSAWVSSPPASVDPTNAYVALGVLAAINYFNN